MPFPKDTRKKSKYMSTEIDYEKLCHENQENNSTETKYSCNICVGVSHFCYSSDMGDDHGFHICTCPDNYLCTQKYQKIYKNHRQFNSLESCIEHIKKTHPNLRYEQYYNEMGDICESIPNYGQN
jgi:hypothetical protein